MPTIIILGSIKITVYADDHNPPHFHVLTVDGDALVSIATLTVLAGRIRAKELRTATDWAAAHITEIEDEWNLLNG